MKKQVRDKKAYFDDLHTLFLACDKTVDEIYDIILNSSYQAKTVEKLSVEKFFKKGCSEDDFGFENELEPLATIFMAKVPKKFKFNKKDAKKYFYLYISSCAELDMFKLRVKSLEKKNASLQDDLKYFKSLVENSVKHK